jgi:hypothetical protein
LVAGPRRAPDTKTDWPTECRSEYNFNFNFNIRRLAYALSDPGAYVLFLWELHLSGDVTWRPVPWSASSSSLKMDTVRYQTTRQKLRC